MPPSPTHTPPRHHNYYYYYYYTDTWKPNVNQRVSVVAACKHSALCSWDYGEGYSCHVWSRADEDRRSWLQCRDNGGGVGGGIVLLPSQPN